PPTERTPHTSLVRRGGLLLREYGLEYAFDDVELGDVALRIDVRSRTAARDFRELLVHVVHAGMRSQRDVRMLRPQEREAPLKVLNDLRVVRVVHQLHPGVDADAAD